MSKINQNLDFQKINLQEINTTKLQNLIQNFENKKKSSKIINSFNLNKNPISISKTENKINKKLHKLGNIDKQIKFLQKISFSINTSPSNLPNINIKTSYISDISEKQIKNEQNILDNILQKYSNKIDNLLTTNTKDAKQDIKKILDLYIINNSNCNNIGIFHPEYKEIKSKLINQLNNDVINKLKGFKFENGKKIDISSLFEEGDCETEQLIKKLANLKGTDGKSLSVKEIKDIIFGVAIVKKDNTLKNLKSILPKYKLSLNDFKGKTKNEITEIFNKNNIPEKEQKIILKKLNNLLKIEKALKIKPNEINDLINKTFIDYNKLHINYFIDNPSLIQNISDINKLENILSNKDFKNKNKDFIETIEISDLNYLFQSNIKTIELFKNQGYLEEYKLDFKDIKDINIKDFSNNGKIRFDILETFDEGALSYIIYNLGTKTIKKHLGEIINKDLLKNITNIIKKLDNSNQDFDTNKLKGEISIDKIPTNEINILDNYLSNNFSLHYIDKIFNQRNVGNLEKLPKTLSKILNNEQFITNILKTHIGFYNFLPIQYKIKFKYIYLHAALNSNINNKEDFISEIPITHINDIIQIFKIIKGFKGINLEKIFKNSKIQNTLLLLLNNTQQKDLESLSPDKKEILSEIQEKVKNFSEKLQNTQKQYKEKVSQLKKKNIITAQNKELINKIFDNKNFIKELLDNDSEIQGPIVGIYRGILGDLSEGKTSEELINNNIKLIVNYLEKDGNGGIKKFTKILEKINKQITSAFEEQTKKEESTPINIYSLNKEEIKKLINLGIINISTKNNKEQNTIGISKATMKDNKIYNINYYGIETVLGNILNNNPNIKYDKAINLLFQTTGIQYLDQEWQSKIKKYLQTKKSIIKYEKVVETITENPDEYYNAYKNNNTEIINNLFKKADNHAINNITQKINFNTTEKNKTTNNTNKTISNSNTETTQTNIYISFELNTDNQSPEIKLNTGEKIQISQKEINIIKSNPEAAKNLINFYKFFKDLNLLGVWKYRKELVKAMGDVNINLEDDSLKKSELVKFGNKLIKLINNLPNNQNGKNIKLNENLDELSKIETELRNFSQANSMLSYGKTFNNLGEDILTANLRELGIIGGACFHIMQFRDILEGKNTKKSFD